jgi:hypothetical protein
VVVFPLCPLLLCLPLDQKHYTRSCRSSHGETHSARHPFRSPPGGSAPGCFRCCYRTVLLLHICSTKARTFGHSHSSLHDSIVLLTLPSSSPPPRGCRARKGAQLPHDAHRLEDVPRHGTRWGCDPRILRPCIPGGVLGQN